MEYQLKNIKCSSQKRISNFLLYLRLLLLHYIITFWILQTANSFSLLLYCNCLSNILNFNLNLQNRKHLLSGPLLLTFNNSWYRGSLVITSATITMEATYFANEKSQGLCKDEFWTRICRYMFIFKLSLSSQSKLTGAI